MDLGKQFFHGSPHVYPEGHVIDPAQPHTSDQWTKPGHAYFTDSPDEARKWGGGTHTYAVQPHGDYQPDAHFVDRPAFVNNKMVRRSPGQMDSGAMSYETPHPLKVMNKVQWPTEEQ